MKLLQEWKEKWNAPMSGKKRLLLVGAVGCLMFGAGITSAMAYLTAMDSAVNVFTVGNIKIDTSEPNWPGNGSGMTTDIVPMTRIPKDPQIHNTGKNDAVVFMVVDIPMEEVIWADETGTRHEEENVELFQFQSGNGGYNSTGAGWSLLETTYLDGNLEPTDPNALTAGLAKPVVDEHALSPDKTTPAYCRRLYGYQDAITSGYGTKPIFTNVRAINFIEGYLENRSLDIIVSSFGLQADNLTYDDPKGDTESIVTKGMSDDTLKKVWKIYLSQSGDVGADNANHTGSTTVNGSTMNVTMTVDNTRLELGTGNIGDAQTFCTWDIAYTGNGQVGGFTLKSSDSSVCTVDADGNIQAVNPGTATITIYVTNPDTGRTLTASADVHVIDVNPGDH